MRMILARVGGVMLAGSAIVGGGSAVAQRVPLPADCRQEIRDLCRDRGGGGVRQCIVAALPRLSDSCRKAIGDRQGAGAPMVAGLREISFGSDPLQRLDLVVPVGAARAPVLLFVHGGGWSIGDKRSGAGIKATHFAGSGWAFASTNYRLVPQATVEQQAADVAGAIAFLRRHAAQNHLDPDRIVLIGHSSGAHLAGLVGTDPRYLAAAGVPMAAVRGVVLLDGAGYDVAAQMARPGNPVGSMYDAAFGKDATRQAALSPTLHAMSPNVADWLILPIERRADSTAQSRGLAAALTTGGDRALVVPVANESHGSLNKGLGEAGDFATGEVDRFLAGLR